MKLIASIYYSLRLSAACEQKEMPVNILKLLRHLQDNLSLHISSLCYHKRICMMIGMYIKGSNHILIEGISWHLPGDNDYPD
jgi:hypothetical protein